MPSSKPDDVFDPANLQWTPDRSTHSNTASEPTVAAPSEASVIQLPQPKRRGVARPARLSAPFVRVPVSWFTTDPRPCPFGQRERLFLLLLHLSRWGQRPVTLTTAVVKEIGLSRAERWRHLRRLEAERWITIERDGNKSVVVHPVVIAG